MKRRMYYIVSLSTQSSKPLKYTKFSPCLSPALLKYCAAALLRQASLLCDDSYSQDVRKIEVSILFFNHNSVNQ